MGILKKLHIKRPTGVAFYWPLLLVVTVAGIGIYIGLISRSAQVPSAGVHIAGAILPHHLLVENFIDDFYAVLAKEINPARIILISPNHFDKGVKYIQTATVTPKDRYNDVLDLQAIRFLASKAGAFIENKYYSVEHGIYVHYPFIKKYFPNALIVPITFKRGMPQAQLDKLIADLHDLQTTDNKNTLILASIDFTHYVSEDIAVGNDRKTIAYLNQWASDGQLRNNPEQIFSDLKILSESKKEKNPEAVAIDSPESLYVLLNELNTYGIHGFTLWKRTSTLSLTGITDPDMNTSHIFGQFL